MDLNSLLDKAKDIAGDVAENLKDDAQKALAEAGEKIKEGGVSLDSLKGAAGTAFEQLKDKATEAVKDAAGNAFKK